MVLTDFLAAAVALGTLVFIYPSILFLRFFNFETKKSLKIAWGVLLLMCAGFYAGYLAVFVHFAEMTVMGRADLAVAFLLVTGSLFVALVAHLLHGMVFSLDRLVKAKTDELERVYKRALETEKEARRLKDQFFFLAVHELRAPVTAMRWSLDMIKENEGEIHDSEEALEMLDNLEKNVASLAGLVNDLLDTSRLEYGTVRLSPQPCVLGEMVTEAVKLIEPTLIKAGLKLETDLGEVGIREVKADSKRVGEVLANLLSNAAKFTMAGGTVGVALAMSDKEYVVSVKDTGVGLDQEDIAKLFQKFTKIDNHPKKEIQSTGLGLYIAKTLVDLWGGRIWVESAGRGKGATFFFTLPR